MKLATIERISEVIPHPNADRLTIYKMEDMSWRVISGEKYKKGDLVCYIQVDTVVPDEPIFEFLRDKKFRVKCIRLRGEYSNGLIVPLSAISDNRVADRFFDGEEWYDIEKGADITKVLKIEKYSKPEPLNNGQSRGTFPTHLLSKTDEERVENYPRAIDVLKGQKVYATIKSDGSSASFINHPEEGFKVCSRTTELIDSDSCRFWEPVKIYNLKEKIPVGYAIQAELIGEKIQGNPESIKGVDIKVFNVWELENRRLLNFQETLDFCEKIGVKTVDIYYVGEFPFDSIEEMIKESQKVKYANGKCAEGLVWRLQEHKWDDRLQKPFSVKSINYNYKD